MALAENLDPTVQTRRVGDTSVKNTKNVALFNRVADVCKQYSFKLEYDFNYTNKPSWLSHTEFMNGSAGVLLHPLCFDWTRKMFDYALSQPPEGDYTADRLIAEFDDKYKLQPYYGKYRDTVVILPGTNLIYQLVDRDKLNAVTAGDHVVKPHPLTLKYEYQVLAENYDVLAANFSAIELVKNCKTLAITGSSEISLYGILLDKNIVDISTQGTDRGGYHVIFRYLMNIRHDQRIDALVHLINSPYSGIFLRGQDDQVERYVTKYKELAIE